MFWTIFTLAALAGDEPSFSWEIPLTPSPVAGECERAVDLVVGKPVPSELLDPDGNVRCFGTVMPTSDLASLLLVDAWAYSAIPRGAKLSLELGWEQERYARLESAFNEPTPWLQRPVTQRTIGHMEAVGVLILAVGVYAILDGEVVQ